MFEIVDSEKKAIYLRDKANITALKKVFCPLIRDQCDPDCVCFCRARCRQNTGNICKEWIVEGGYCNNHMFRGVD